MAKTKSSSKARRSDTKASKARSKAPAKGRKAPASRATKAATPQAPPTTASRPAERRALKAVALMRTRGLSRSKAAKRAGTTPRTVQKYAEPALTRREGHYTPTAADQLLRPMRVLTETGVVIKNIRSSRTASALAYYWAAVDHYLKTGDRSRLAPYQGRRFHAGGKLMPFLTDPDLLARLADVGEVRFEDLYETTA